MRRTGEIRTVRDAEYDDELYDEVAKIARDLAGLAFSMGVMVLIVFLAGGWV